MDQQFDTNSQGEANGSVPLIAPITLPKGGGAIRGIGEKFGTNPVTGTASISIPIFTSPGRTGFGPALALHYDSGAGNGVFGLGWNLPIPSVSRKTDKGLPQYRDDEESDVFILSEAEDLVPLLVPLTSTPGKDDWAVDQFAATLNGASYTVRRYRPRIEGLFARIERWRHEVTGVSFWKTLSKDNVTSIYGGSDKAQITDPDHPTHVFKWLLEYSHDDKGNVIVYDYKPEDRINLPDAPHESNRTIGSNRYLKSIWYGNTAPYFPDPQAQQPTILPTAEECLFLLVFDYGEHDMDLPRIEEDVTWPVRQDPFSNFRAGFEIRTLRLCRRALMFHRFAELGATPCLVRSTDFSHVPAAYATLLAAAWQTGYLHNPQNQTYQVFDPATQERLSPKSLPPLEFSYSSANIDQTLRNMTPEVADSLPYGIDGIRYQWLDLDSEGAPGILSEQSTGWYYQRNVSNLARDAQGNIAPDGQGAIRACLDPAQWRASRPSMSALADGKQQFLDLDGEGQQCLVEFAQPVSGFHALQDDGNWQAFTSFIQIPQIDWSNPNLRSIDLDGDGHADLLVGEDEIFTWYRSLGKAGFDQPMQVRVPADEEHGPAVLFEDDTQAIYLADMTGDGLTDIVRIRNGDICYWPNLGYGRFGAQITMSDAPLFDTPDLFDQKRLRLADIDGSGTTDIVYLGRGGVHLYFNQAGNSWSAVAVLDQFPVPDNTSTVATVDLLGNGTVCLVWSSPLPADAGYRMCYVDLMGGQKPHLMTAIKNNLGAETRVRYAASSKFYLQDRLTGKPWITKLPFPVHVVEQVETDDVVSQTRFVSRYAYHHGYFDGSEREFRGFGMVEQWDTEVYAVLAEKTALNIDQASHIPPVLTRTWYHTGAYLQQAHISLQFKDQYYRAPGQDDAQRDAMLLLDTVLPAEVTLPDGTRQLWQLSAQEEREACRALKGMVLRREVYALDGSAQEPHPYSVSERNYTVLLLHPCCGNRHAVFFTQPREAIEYHYERALYAVAGQQQKRADPRVSHTMILATDAYGNVLQSAAISYGRCFPASSNCIL